MLQFQKHETRDEVVYHGNTASREVFVSAPQGSVEARRCWLINCLDRKANEKRLKSLDRVCMDLSRNGGGLPDCDKNEHEPSVFL